MHRFAAVDLGASSGRVMLAQVGNTDLRLTEVRRFDNRPVRVAGTLHWNVLELFREVLDGLRTAANTFGPVESVGIDSWGVDYGLLDASGSLLGNPVHYRDSRTDGVMDAVLAEVGAEELYAATGIQFLPINTLFQLVAASRAGQLDRAETLLMIPDLICYWLTGIAGAEVTNASTTALYDVRAHEWARPLIHRLGLPERIFPPLRAPGEPAGVIRPDVAEGLADGLAVTVVGSHDTASAVAAVPAGDRFAYISCGTWSLVGVELAAPVLSPAGRAANFTNEEGIDGTIRYLRNLMGLWLLQESLRGWGHPDLAPLLAAAERIPPFRALVDAGDPEFLPPGDMPARIAARCRATGQQPPTDRPGLIRCILESLALAYRVAIRDAVRLSGRDVDVVHIVGGGCHNTLLCRLTADACGLPVLAGPVEATAMGNALVQARAAGVVTDLAEMRDLVRRSQPIQRYEPRGDESAWAQAAARIGLAEGG